MAIGELTPAQSFAAIDHDTILLLFAMMLLIAYLERGGLFERIALGVLLLARTPVQLLVLVSLLSAGLSAVFVNDAVCLLLTPVVIGVAINTVLLWLYFRRWLPKGPILSMAEALAMPLDPLVVPVALLVVAGFLAGGHLGYVALAGALVFVVRDREPPEAALARVDWGLLVFFCGLFIVVAGLAGTGLVDLVWAQAAPVQRWPGWRCGWRRRWRAT